MYIQGTEQQEWIIAVFQNGHLQSKEKIYNLSGGKFSNLYQNLNSASLNIQNIRPNIQRYI